MTHGSRPGLRIPKLLAVSALGIVAGCPSGDDGDTGNESGPSMTTSEEGSTTVVAEGSTTTPAATETTAADATSGATETDTGALPDCQANEDQTACEGTESCIWLPELGGCIIDCTIIEDEATCAEQLGCEWYGEFCDFEPLA
jgi:hypothetical protein